MNSNFYKNRGVALFMVLWLLMLLSVIVGEFCYAMRTEVNITRNLKEKTQAYYTALAGIHRGIAEAVILSAENKLLGNQQIDSDGVLWRVNADLPWIAFNEGCYRVRLDNESGKVNLNLADNATLVGLLDSFEMTDKNKKIILDSILDWRDKNSFHRVNGAEDDYYLSLADPYPCKDDDFESVEELLLVRGVTSDFFHNSLKHIFTVFAEEKNTKSPSSKKTTQKRQKINVNAAPPEVLLALPGMTRDIVESIVEYRKEHDFKSLAELIPIMGSKSYVRAVRYLKLKNSAYYTISAEGHIANSPVTHTLRTLVKIEPKSKRKYRILSWWDRIDNRRH